MSRVSYQLDHRFKTFAYPALIVLIASVVRLIPILLAWPYPTGFDTTAFYLPRMIAGVPNLFSIFYLAQLHQFILSSIYLIFPYPFIVLDAFAVIIQASLSFVFYFYARKVIGLSEKLSFAVSAAGVFNLLSLRLTWDQYRLSLGLTLAILALIALSSKSGRVRYAAVPLTILVIFSNQVPAAILIVSVLIHFIRKRDWSSKSASEFLVIVLGSLLFVVQQLPLSSNNALTTSVPVTIAPGLPGILAALGGVGYLLFMSWPLLLFLPFVKIRNQYHHLWLLVVFFFAFLIPLVGLLVVPSPFTYLMMVFPLVMTFGLALSHNETKSFRRLVLASMAISVVISMTYVMSPSVPSPYSLLGIGIGFQQVMPSSYAQSTVPISQEGQLMNLLGKAITSVPPNSTLFLPAQFYGLSYMFANPNHLNITNLGIVSSTNNSLVMISSHKGSYTVWWTTPQGWYGISSLPSSFHVWLSDGEFSIYEIR